MNKANESMCDIGMIGLGVMGRNLLLNMADHGFKVAGYDKDIKKVESLRQEAQSLPIYGATTIEEFLNHLKKPRAIILLVPAGSIVDAVINELTPHLESGDLIIDAGNSHFTDTNRRIEFVDKLGFEFMGMGISGGEEGARHGPSIMPGGSKSAYERIRPIMEAVAAKAQGMPCVTYLGLGSVGHFVKMVHNGIEYGLMQLIAETYDLMKRGLGLTNAKLHEVYHSWNESEVGSYLIEITSIIFATKDAENGADLIDEIVGVAKQKGTGMWTSESSLELQVPVPTIDLAMAMRDLSGYVIERKLANTLYPRPIELVKANKEEFITQLKSSFYVAMIVVYAQGMTLLQTASKEYSYDLNLEAVARIWGAGCIIRAKVLEKIRQAFELNPRLANLLLDGKLSHEISMHQEDLRKVVCESIQVGIPIPALMMTLSYLDAYRSAWQPANLIQAQRDFFGSHTYERIGKEGSFHTQWG